MHGACDKTCPLEQSSGFAAALRGIGAEVELRIYPETTHTDPILEQTMVANPSFGTGVGLPDGLNPLAELVAVVTGSGGHHAPKLPPGRKPLEAVASSTLINLARTVIPF